MEENFQRGIFGGELSEGNIRRGESSRREIFEEGNLRGGEFPDGNLRRVMFVGGKVSRFYNSIVFILEIINCNLKFYNTI